MFYNSVTTAWRSLRRHGGYTAINGGGLALGLAVCLLIALYIRHEVQYDRFHEAADRIHRLVQAEPAGKAFGLSSVQMFDGSVQVPPGVAQALTEQVAGIAQATAVSARGDRLLGHADQRLYVDRLLRADTSFFEVFSFELLRGDRASVLDAPGRIVLTASLAERMFGDADPMGRRVVYENKDEYTVAGIVADPPSTSHMQFDAIRSFSEAERGQRYGDTVRWRFFAERVYVVLQEGANAEAVREAIRAFDQRNAPEWRRAQAGLALHLQPLTAIHLYSAGLDDEGTARGDIRFLYFFGLIGLLILGMACVNYMNLATARASTRAREVGVRKTMGAGQAQLTGQFLVEATLTAALALPVALGLAHLALPVVNDVAGTTLRLGDVPVAVGLGVGGLVVGLVGLVAGSYPAFVLSRFQPAQVLMQAGGSRAGSPSAWLRKGLVVGQFAASVALLLGTFVVHEQLAYVQNKQLGFDDEHVITFRKSALGESYDAFADALRQQTAIAAVSAGPPLGVGHRNMSTTIEHATTGDEQRITAMFVDYGYVDAFGLTLLEGRAFTPDRPADVNQGVILSEAAVAAYGLGGSPVGQQIAWGNQQRTVVGVVQDMHNESLHDAIQPVVLVLNPAQTWTAAVRLAPGATQAGLDAVRATWARFLPDRPFTFTFLDQHVEAQYRAEQRLATLFSGFAGLAILVAALGLVGLAAFMTQQRTKEIGIRKALGATVASIVGRLSREFVALVGVAFVVSAPLAYIAMQQWMRNFAFQVDLGAGLFLTVGAVVLVVALAAVGYHAARAASTDPACALRDD